MTTNHSSIDIRTDQIKVWKNDKVVTRLAQNGCFEEYPTKTYTWSKPTGVGLTPFAAGRTEVTFKLTRIGNMRIMDIDPRDPWAYDHTEFLSIVVPVDSEDVPVSMQNSLILLRNMIAASAENTSGSHGVANGPAISSFVFGRVRVSNVVNSPSTTATPNAILLEINPYTSDNTANGVVPYSTTSGGTYGWDRITLTYTAVGSADPTPLI